MRGPGNGKPRECASYANRFVDNRLVSDHWNGKTKEWQLEPPGQLNAGEAGCAIPAGEQRVHVSGNTKG
ncbi:hypothetical protein JOF56_009282 [Kibdelosporangium banguiense]|uniref:Uncharacterized protein n=1 Tax=Kibdelosporangium banguiense TaxID=1365924 RepID=A0ABS4TWY4_9PSEU|nr:hypothetical protein [Kibdelosporangium banguiense]MBP2328897.1 hypothetical protein [Kibdelosporangium banguiense]